MGLYHTVYFSCPRCQKLLEHQSKALDGFLSHDQDEVPPEIAVDIEGEYVRCNECDDYFTIIFAPDKKTVRMRLVKD